MLTIAQIHNGIAKEIDRQEELVDEMANCADLAAEADVAYKTALAQARLTVRAKAREKVTIDEVADRAQSLIEEMHLQYVLATNRMTVLREALRSSQSRLDGYRSLLVSFRQAGG